MKLPCYQAKSKEEGDESQTVKSKYDNPILAVLFPLTFFSTIVGVTFLTWPINFKKTSVDNELTDIFIIGIFLSGVAGISGVMIIVIICYLHTKSFDRKKLASLALDYTRLDRQQTTLSHKTPDTTYNDKRAPDKAKKTTTADISAKCEDETICSNIAGKGIATNLESGDNSTASFKIERVSSTSKIHPKGFGETESQDTHL